MVHTASPVPTDMKGQTEKKVVVPALAGTKAVMEACISNKVKRVVVTSSVAAMMANRPPKLHTTAEDWSDPNYGDPYFKSKTLSERMVWDMAKEGDLEAATILPGIVTGPAYNKVNFASGEFLKLVAMNKISKLPHVWIPLVDVRDVAKAHVQAILVPEANGKRFVLVNKMVEFMEVPNMLREKWGKDYKLQT